MIKNLGQVAAIYVGKTAPRNVNMIWLDNTVIPYVFKSYNGEEWTEIPTGAWIEAYVNGWLVSLQQRSVTTDDDYVLVNSGGVNYKMTVKDFVKSSVGNPLDFKGVIRTDADFPNPSTLESGDMYIIITEPAGGTVTDPYSGKTFSDSEKIVWDSVINGWASLGKIDVKVDLSTTYSTTEVTIHSSAGKETTVVGVTDDNAGVMVPVQKKWLDSLSNGSTLTPQGPLTAPYHKHRYSDIVDRIISQQVTGDSAINPMSQKATTEALDLKLDKSAVLQVSGVSTTDVMSQKAVTDAIQTLKLSVDDKLSRYLPLSGGTMTGNIVLANSNVRIQGTGSDGTTNYHVVSLDTENRPTFGSPSVGIIIQTNTENILHRKANGTYIVHDTSNLIDPAKLSANQTFTGENNFTAGNFNVVGDKSKFSINDIGGLRMYYDYADDELGISRYLDFYTKTSSDTDYTRRGVFGLYTSKSTPNSDWAYIGIGDVGSQQAQYKFSPDILFVPETFYIKTITSRRQLIGVDNINNRVRFGGVLIPTWIISNNTDLFHSKYTNPSTHSEYKIWDESNLPSPVQTSDLADYVIKSDLDAYATKQWVTDNFSGGGSGTDLLPANNTWTGTNTYTKNVVLANNVKLISSKVNGTLVNLIQEDSLDNLIIGNGSAIRIYGEGNLMHYKGSSAYTIYDTANLIDPATKQWVDEQGYITGADIPPIVIANSGSGNAVTSITSTGHALTVTKGATYLTQSSLAGYATETWVTNKGYLTSSSLDEYAKTTDLSSYLPLIGGSMTGAINFNSSQILTLKNKPLVAYDSTSNYVNIGSYSLNSRLFFLTSQTDLQHYRKNDGEEVGTSYKIWDAYNVSRPLDYVNGTAGSVTSVYARNLNLNGTDYPFIGTGTSVVTLFAPTTAGTSGQILQSQGAGKAPVWVDGGTGGGVQLSDNNTWTGLNTFQGGLKTSDGTNSYDVWDNNSLKYPVKYAINSTGTGYALSFYSKTAGWKEIDTLTTKYLTSATVKSISAGGDGYIGIGTNAYASAAISEINTNSIYFRGLNNTVLSTNDDGKLEYGSSSNYAGFNSRDIRIAYPIASSGGGGGGGGGTTNPSEGGLTISYYPVNQKNNVTERAKIYCTTVNLYLKDLNKNTQLDFDTDGLYVTTGSTSKVRLATLNDISGSGSSVSLDGNNTWTGTNTFKSTIQTLAQQNLGVGGTLSSGYGIKLEHDGGNNAEFKLEGHLYVDSIRFNPSTPYATLTVGGGLFTFDGGGSLTTKISGTEYEFWNKKDLPTAVSYTSNTAQLSINPKIPAQINTIEYLALSGLMANNNISLTQGGNGEIGSIDSAFAEAYIGDVHANNIIVSKIPVKDSENYFEITADGMYFYDTVNQMKYKLTMEQVS